MKKEEKFNSWLESIPLGIYVKVRATIIFRCGITSHIFNNWKTNRTEIPLLAKKEIDQIASNYGLSKPFEHD